MDDRHDLVRFLRAQEDLYDTALAELHSGRKRSHWMWFIFPQFEGLGHSPMAKHYAISCMAEARAYLAHPVLGTRLLQCTDAMLGLQGLTAHEILGSPDDLKFKSCMTLFERAAGEGSAFSRAIDRYFDGSRDTRTLDMIDR